MEKKGADVFQNLWSFHYRKGAAFMSGIVSAKNQETAILVAAEWCRKAAVKKLTDPRPMILADESILLRSDIRDTALQPNADAVMG